MSGVDREYSRIVRDSLSKVIEINNSGDNCSSRNVNDEMSDTTSSNTEGKDAMGQNVIAKTSNDYLQDLRENINSIHEECKVYGSQGPSEASLAKKETVRDEINRKFDYKSTDVITESLDLLISCMMPNKESISIRERIISFVSSTIVDCFPRKCKIEVIPFGSVPLRTYLPDGDIDFGIFCQGEQLQSSWLYILQATLIEKAKFCSHNVSDVHIVEAEVRVCKCFIDGYEIDISLNMAGGISTLAFLERIDIVIGKDHLFKRSVVLIKTWCYYESRLMGGHNNLISTYALEIMILCIINKYYHLIQTPTQTFILFLREYSNFDWTGYCLGLKGETRLTDLTLQKEHVTNNETAARNFIGPDLLNEITKVYGYNMHSTCKRFQIRSINILDPLVPYNNIGRSISKANSYRIVSACRLGWERFEKILNLDLTSTEADSAIKLFFRNTWRLCESRMACFDVKSRQKPYEILSFAASPVSSPTNSPQNSLICSPLGSPQSKFLSNQSTETKNGKAKLPAECGTDSCKEVAIGKEVAKWAADLCSKQSFGQIGSKRTTSIGCYSQNSQNPIDIRNTHNSFPAKSLLNKTFSSHLKVSIERGLKSVKCDFFSSSMLDDLRGISITKLHKLMDIAHSVNETLESSVKKSRIKLSFKDDSSLQVRPSDYEKRKFCRQSDPGTRDYSESDIRDVMEITTLRKEFGRRNNIPTDTQSEPATTPRAYACVNSII